MRYEYLLCFILFQISMKNIKIPQSEIQELLLGEAITFPKYVTQILVLANQNAQGTRPKIVGQMSELIQVFDGKTLNEWIAWYTKMHPDSSDKATDKIFEMVQKLKQAISQIDRGMVKKWVEELLHLKTFSGLKFQQVILTKVAQLKNTTYRLSSTEEESKGIDGFIGHRPVSIKPSSYKTMSRLKEVIEVAMIYFEKRKDGLVIEFDF